MQAELATANEAAAQADELRALLAASEERVVELEAQTAKLAEFDALQARCAAQASELLVADASAAVLLAQKDALEQSVAMLETHGAEQGVVLGATTAPAVVPSAAAGAQQPDHMKSFGLIIRSGCAS